MTFIRHGLEQGILNNAVFQSIIGTNSPAQLKELAGSSLENIQNDPENVAGSRRGMS